MNLGNHTKLKCIVCGNEEISEENKNIPLCPHHAGLLSGDDKKEIEKMLMLNSYPSGMWVLLIIGVLAIVSYFIIYFTTRSNFFMISLTSIACFLIVLMIGFWIRKNLNLRKDAILEISNRLRNKYYL